ncbi:MAG: thioredoxin family protein [Bacteroidetes bacterium]|nr:MAG: thioredoxin family protein [Bacteroidota bacterium]
MIYKTQRKITASIIFLFIVLTYSCKMFSHNTDPKGIHTREILNDSRKYDWFALEYKWYNTNHFATDRLNQYLTPEHEFIVFGGTWCGDTKNLLPKFYKILDTLAAPPKVTLVLVDMNKQSGTDLEEQYKIEYVPTFIILKDGKEVGRVVESTKQPDLESDLADIVNPVGAH